ncbi:hypothetical protein [Rummeliibacillus suwonensis]|jgi:hypothetical protein|uniref:hypothetical protein n=1 Tax=Rummeliibacillus suwonensis TaxID=1306154 RepID=UPI001AAE91D4|nr:hypothetical protein [Rummeliibacillus suwonensis]MBO2535774.1 hypothetical protein [Rummeliibacillus suwonensis]
MKKARENQMIYLFIGVLLTGVGTYINYDDILHLRFPDGMMSLFLGTSSLMMAYLSPHLFPRDERTSEIIGKSMSVNYFVLFGTILILFLVTGSLGPLSLTATQVLIVLFCVMITSIPATMIVYSKRI